jgi:hypothetical protein
MVHSLPPPRCRPSVALGHIVRRISGSRHAGYAVLILLWLAASPVQAQTNCPLMDRDLHFPFPNPSGLNEYRVNVGNFAQALNLTQNEAIAVVGHAAAAWNLHGSTGYFRYAGTTTRQGPDLCADPGNWNLVTMHSNTVPCQAGAYGFAEAICDETRWWINICPGQSWSFSGTPLSGEADLISVLAHEMGHVLNLAHPNASVCSGGTAEGAVICTDVAVNNTRLRDLYPYDTRCLFQAGDGRNVSVTAVPQLNGAFLTPYLYAGAPAAYKGHPNVRWSGANTYWSRVLHRDGEIPARTDLSAYLGITGTSTVVTTNLGQRSHVPSMTWWPERSSELRAFYHLPYGGASWTQAFAAVMAVYNLNLSSSPNLYYLNHCLDPGCSGFDVVRTGHRLAHAWDDFNNESVTVWAHQNRQTNSQEREIRIAHDVYDFSLNAVGRPTYSGRQTTVAPAIACKAYQADGSYDCILAYVPFGTADGTIALGMFYEVQGQYYWRSSDVLLPYRTYQGVALWYQSGYWWLAYNDFFLDVRVVRSTNGVSWTSAGNLGRSYQAPAVAAHYTGSLNYVFVAR